ncbi:MAG: HlyD family efflux transporter periplasmic adaptor subunit [Deltaproteobacteria bacterium]|jgi:macrolide-specific efflux system membrane fusion protein|nr:HlyD family efflux transporter periplasmic adaptor subunit [Deltaproteobacteria bacterium]
MKKKWVWIVVIAAVFAAGFWGIRRRNAAKSETLEAVVEGPIIEAVYAIGKIEAVRRFQAKAGVPSGISKLPVREGMNVQRFDALVHFVEGTVIRAPFSGIVSRVNYKVGESVFSGNVVVEVIDPSEFEVRVVLDQRAAMRVKRGQIGKMSFDGLRDKAFEAEVRAVYSSDSQFTVLLVPRTLPAEVLEGMTADISIEVNRKASGRTVPIAALQNGSIIRVRSGKRETVAIQAGIVNAERVEVLAGDIAIDDQVVVKAK